MNWVLVVATFGTVAAADSWSNVTPFGSNKEACEAVAAAFVKLVPLSDRYKVSVRCTPAARPAAITTRWVLVSVDDGYWTVSARLEPFKTKRECEAERDDWVSDARGRPYLPHGPTPAVCVEWWEPQPEPGEELHLRGKHCEPMLDVPEHWLCRDLKPEQP